MAVERSALYAKTLGTGMLVFSRTQRSVATSLSVFHFGSTGRLIRAMTSVVQNKTSTNPPYYNIQVQVNNSCTVSVFKRSKKESKKAGSSVAKALIPADNSWDAEAIREALYKGKLI
ncbi:hypothetical protein F5B20DRAFT_580607 [Whalleya microplaca]|nr:hypothetical protein F5B20DRAFT_580607 [Whalleya microplaca]